MAEVFNRSEYTLAGTNELSGDGQVACLIRAGARRLGHLVSYVRRRDVQGGVRQIQIFVRQHPGQSVLTAAALGFLAGSKLRRDA